MDYDILSAFILATALLSVAPGPDNIFVLTLSISHGIGYGIITTAGLMTGCLVHTSVLAFGLAAIIRDNTYVFMIIKVCGALYLFYLAYKVLRSTPAYSFKSDTPRKKGLWLFFRQGFIMNVMNPKVAIFFLAFFPAFLFSKSISLFMQFYILGGIFILVSFSVFAGIAILAGVISGYLRSEPGIGKALKWIQVVVFSGIGIYLLFSVK